MLEIPSVINSGLFEIPCMTVKYFHLERKMNNLKYLRGRFSKNMTYGIIFPTEEKRLHYIPYFSLAVADILRVKLSSLTEMSPGQIPPFATNDD